MTHGQCCSAGMHMIRFDKKSDDYYNFCFLHCIIQVNTKSEKISQKSFRKKSKIGIVNWAAFVQPNANSAVHVFEKYERPSSARVIKSPAESQGLFLHLRLRL